MNKCTSCKTPLLAAYCAEHEPSKLVRLARKIDISLTRIKLFFTGYRAFEVDDEEIWRI